MGKRVVSKFRLGAVNLEVARAVDRLAGLIWPPACLVCGQAAEAGLDCCPGCRRELPRPTGSCRRCALALPRDVDLCGACTRRPPPFQAAFAGFVYAPPVDRLIQRFKFQRDPAAGRLLARITAEALAARAAPRPDLMVPVPLHWRRRLARGFNQAEVLCRDLGRHFGGLPWAPLLRRHRPTVAQSELPATRRAGNVRGAFSVERLPAGAGHVALVDDVMTTGSTLAECARVLGRAGAGRVDVWVVARA